jgi:hypothetical protein
MKLFTALLFFLLSLGSVIGQIPAVHGVVSSSSVGVTPYYRIPAEFSSVFTDQIWRDGEDIATDYDFDAIKNSITGNIAYVDPVNGLNTNNGSEGSPFKTLGHAFGQTSFKIYRLKTGVLWDYTTASSTINRTMKLEPWGDGYVELSTKIALTGWIQNVTYPNVYQIQNTHPTQNVASVMDRLSLDAEGISKAYFNVAGESNVNANPGSFYYNVGTDVLYVHTFNGRVPDSDVHIFLNTSVVNLTRTVTSGDDQYVHFQKIKFYGGLCMQIANTGAGYWHVGYDDCEFSYAGSITAAFYVPGRARGFIKDCVGYYNRGDVFDYASPDSFFLEWNVIANHHTYNEGISANGSTSHEYSKVIRVNCNYQNTYGKPVQDIHASQTLSIRCAAGNSLVADPHDYPYASNSVVDGRVTKMWLYECRGIGIPTRGFWNFANSEMNIYDGDYGNLLTLTNREDVGSITNILIESEVYQ